MTFRLYATIALVTGMMATVNAARPTSRFVYRCDAAPAMRCTFTSTSLGNPNKLSWSWGDGKVETRLTDTASHVWSSPGLYTVRLDVYDSIGGHSYSTKKLSFAAAAKPDTVTIVRVDTVKVPCPCDTVPTKQPPPVVTPPPAGEVWAELPRVYLDTKLIPPTGKILSVPVGANLQAALNAAQGGDVIELANAGTWSGNFTLPTKAGNSWIVIRPADMTAVPPEGTRMRPMATLPKILSASNLGAIATDTGAHHWRLIALDVSVPATISNTGLVRLGSSYETTIAQMPHDLVLDRMYIHGTPTGNVRRCVALNSAASAVIDSYLSDCHEAGTDAQAIAGWSGPGPFKITNNYLEASSENIIFGGTDPTIQGLIPSDIEIRHNHMTKPVSWLGGPWVIKNLFELKNAQRVLVEGNVFENNWANGQAGSAINLKSVNQSGACPWCIAADITFRLNVIRNTGSGFNLSGYDAQTPGKPIPMTRVTITENLLTNMNVPPFDGDGRGFLINSNPIELTIAHNTILDATNSAVSFGGPTTQLPTRLTIRDNIIGGGLYGVKGPGLSTVATFAAFIPAGFTNNLLIQAAAAGYPTGTIFSSVAGVGFAADFSLSPTSKYKATTGRDPGANVAAVLSATANVVQP